MFKDEDVVLLSTIRWNFLWQRHQIFASALARDARRVFYVENLNSAPDVSFSLCKKIFQAALRIIWRAAKAGANPIPHNVIVITPVVLPGNYAFIQLLNRVFFLPLLLLHLRLRGVRNPVVWTYLPTQIALQAIRSLKPRFLVYDCVFDVSLHPDYPKDSAQAEKEITECANIVLTDNLHLMLKGKERNPHTYLLPAGVDYPAFAAGAYKHDNFFAGIAHPRICFFGGIDAMRIDMDLIAYVARQRPDWNIVLLGPVIKTDISNLCLANIFFKGSVPFKDLPRHLNTMDVLMLPYKIIPFSKSIFPAKLFECLASGLPVVATPLDEIQRLPAGLIETARTPEAFVKAIENSLRCDTEENKRARRQAAQANSWDNRINELEDIIRTERQDYR